MILLALLGAGFVLAYLAPTVPAEFHFAILGDRTGEAVPGVFEQALKDVEADRPAFVINVGDLVQGYTNSAELQSEWKQVRSLLASHQRLRFFFVPGNHDVWSDASARAYQINTGRPLHYSFDYHQAHFTVLDNSRADQLAPSELAFLNYDLQAHQSQPVKFVFFHRPSWLLSVLLRNSHSPLEQLARKYSVQYVVCGHIHQMLTLNLAGTRYLSMVSSGGHLRARDDYEKGWFFGHALVTVNHTDIDIQIREENQPFGEGRIAGPERWNALALAKEHL